MPKPVILVVDDSDILLDRMKYALEQADYVVITTSQTVGAARHLRQTNLVIIDWHMPGISGGEVLQSFLAACAGSAARPLFYLYTSDPMAAKSAKKLGFDGCFVEKGNDAALVSQVGAALRIAKLKARTGGAAKPK
jgi:two-component system, OmpR family, response regulator